MIVVIQQCERAAVTLNHRQHLRTVERLLCALHKLNHLAQLAQTLRIDRVILEDIVLQHFVGPTAELDTAVGFDPIAHRNDHIEIVIFDESGDGTLALLLNCRKFCDS